MTTAMTTNWPQSDKGQPARPAGTFRTSGHQVATQPMYAGSTATPSNDQLHSTTARGATRHSWRPVIPSSTLGRKSAMFL